MNEQRTITSGPSLRLAVVVLGVMAYVPAFLAAPGRMPADSKLYLYLDPGRFLADAAGSFDPRQFAGWVPHQHLSYLWPAGPWFWVFELIGVPDWIAHRLWVGSIMLAAGLGTRWCARLLGLSPIAALTAAIVYQVSPYVLPYVSRTSVMLLPWAGLGWLVAFTVRALRRQTWTDPAAIGLVVVTVGAVNATALAMIVPGPVLWLVHEGWRRSASWREVAFAAARIGVFGLGASLWWITMLALQGRHGTDVLPYSESLGDVSLTATSTEVWRGLGYWLFYIRDPFSAATTESLRYLSSTPAIAISFLLPVMGLAALGCVRWAHRRFAAMLVAVGVVLAVGVHPSEDRSPLMRVLTGDGDGGLALALRSSSRALPLVWLGFALALGATVAAASPLRIRWGAANRSVGPLAAGVVVVIVLANLPGMWTGAWVDPALERDQDPPVAWREAGRALDRAEDGARVLQLPGAEFGAFRWGYTVDQPLPSLTERPLVTRDLLPLGSPAAMDLLYALDDRIQAGILESPTLAPVSRLLGVDTVWLANDGAFERFRTARPEIVRDLVADAPGIERLRPYGDPMLNSPDVAVVDERSLSDPRVGEPQVPVELADIAEPVGVVRAKATEVIVSGSGDGLVDAAAAGLIDGTATIRYSGSLTDDEMLASLDRAAAVIVTDSNRSEARHWRSSQDTRGFTESADPALALLRDVPSDERLPVFDLDEPSARTTAEQRGPVRATATSYGEPFAYLPEHRPYMAIDGDPATAWLVGEHGDPVGETLRLMLAEPVDQILLRQPDPDERRSITTVSILDAAAAKPRFIRLDDRSRTGTGQPIAISGDTVDITIEEVGGGRAGSAGAVAGVGFAEIGVGLGPTTEVVRPPDDALAIVPDTTPVALVFSRLRSDALNRWRDDPEPAMVREFDLRSDRSMTVEVTARIDPHATDADLARLFGWPVAANSRLAGSPRSAGVFAIDDDPSTSWITAFDDAVGAVLTIDDVDAPVATLAIHQPITGFSRVTGLVVRSGAEERLVELAPDASGTAQVEIDPPLPPGRFEIEIAAIDATTTVDRRHGDLVELPAAVSEIVLAGGPDPSTVNTTGFSTACTTIGELDGDPVSARFAVTDDAWLEGAPIRATPCSPSFDLGSGRHLLQLSQAELPIDIDRVVFEDGAIRAVREASPEPQATVTSRSRFDRAIIVRSCPDGCWLVLGEGHNRAWAANADGDDLGPPVLVDGGFNGWWIPATAAPVLVEVRWTAQTPLTLALLATVAIVVGALSIVLLGRRRYVAPPELPMDPPSWAVDEPPVDRRRAVAVGVLWALVAGLFIAPAWAIAGLLAGAALVVTGRRRLAELTAWACVTTGAAATVVIERRDAPLPDGGWPTTFEQLHGTGMFAAVSVVIAIVLADDARDAGRFIRPHGASPRSTDIDEPADVGDPTVSDEPI